MRDGYTEFHGGGECTEALAPWNSKTPCPRFWRYAQVPATLIADPRSGGRSGQMLLRRLKPAGTPGAAGKNPWNP